MFMRPALERETDLREKLGKIRVGDGALDAYLEDCEGNENADGCELFTVKPTLSCNINIHLEILRHDAQLGTVFQ